jgi:hydroxymethylglutaryl-CoA lyase
MDVTLVEVGPRDGLQNESAVLATADKAAFVNLLSAAGLPVIEAAAFVSPRWVPQMADAADVFASVTRRPGVRYTALVPNVAGLERAKAAGVREIAIFAAASETFSQRNINQSIDASLAGYAEVARLATADGMRVRGYLSTAFGCPYEGDVPIARVVDLSERLLSMGAFEVAVSDTIGVAHPAQVRTAIQMLAPAIGLDRLALHFHDTRGTALANVLVALEAGVRTFDASAGGLGGCPFAPGAAGNVATEDVVYMLDGLGAKTGVDLDALVRASRFIEEKIGRALPSRYYQAARRATYRAGRA